MANYKFCKLSESVSTVYMRGIDKCSLHISTTNSKLGFIPSFNLLPGVTCSKESCTHCLREGCYAVKNAFRIMQCFAQGIAKRAACVGT